LFQGAIFPDYELSDHNAKRRKLSELQELRDQALGMGITVLTPP
jgi:hypothetical protein